MLESHKDQIKTIHHMMKVWRMDILLLMIKIKMLLLVKYGLEMQPSQILPK